MAVDIVIVGGKLNGQTLRIGGKKESAYYLGAGKDSCLHVKCADGKYRPLHLANAHEKHRTKKYRLTE